MINESQFSSMLPKEYCVDTVFVHQSFMSLFNGMLSWVGDVLYPRFNYKVITTYDKAVEVFKKKQSNANGQTDAAFLPALTLDPNLDFSNEERAGRFLWMFKNLDTSKHSMWNSIKLTDQGVVVTPMFTRYQGTVEITGWFTSIYDMIDFRTTLIQYCGGYQRWIRPECFWTHLILPKELFGATGPEGKLNWDGINPEIITLTSTTTKEYALPYQMDAMWRLDSFADGSNKMGADQIAEYKCSASFTWECNIPTFFKIQNYQYPLEKINLNVSMTPTFAKYPLKMGFETYNKLNLYREIVPFSKIMPIYNIKDDAAVPLIKMQDDMCYGYPEKYMRYNHYVIGKVYDITKLTSPDQIENIDSTLVIDKYKSEYLPYIRKCRGLVSHYDKTTSFDLLNVVKNYNISLLCGISNDQLFNAIKSLHGKVVTFDSLGKVIYDGKMEIGYYDHKADFTKFVFNHNIVRMIKRWKLEEFLKKERQNTAAVDGLHKQITESKQYLCETFTANENQKVFESNYVINKNCTDDFCVKVNKEEIKEYQINGYRLLIGDSVDIHAGDQITLLHSSDVVREKVTLICNYKITKEDEYNYYYNKKYLEVDISECKKVDTHTVQCISYNGLMNQTIDFTVDPVKKVIVFKLEPHRDCYIQIYGCLS